MDLARFADPPHFKSAGEADMGGNPTGEFSSLSNFALLAPALPQQGKATGGARWKTSSAQRSWTASPCWSTWAWWGLSWCWCWGWRRWRRWVPCVQGGLVTLCAHGDSSEEVSLLILRWQVLEHSTAKNGTQHSNHSNWAFKYAWEGLVIRLVNNECFAKKNKGQGLFRLAELAGRLFSTLPPVKCRSCGFNSKFQSEKTRWGLVENVMERLFCRFSVCVFCQDIIPGQFLKSFASSGTQ